MRQLGQCQWTQKLTPLHVFFRTWVQESPTFLYGLKEEKQTYTSATELNLKFKQDFIIIIGCDEINLLLI